MALLSVLLAAVALPAAAAPSWPVTELAAHARAWFEMLNGDESAARRFLSEHFAPSALAEASVDERLRRRLAMLDRTQGLTPLEVLESAPASLAVRCSAGNGDAVVATFEAESTSPHRLVGVRLDASPGDQEREPVRAPGARQVPKSAPLDDAEAVKQVRAHLDAQATAGEFSGVALLARGDATLLDGAWGLADRAKQAPIDMQTRFNLGSIGKLFTRAAVAQLAEAGKLSLDDTLSRYLPEFPHADSITIEMLCRHRSGVGDFFNDAYRAMDRSKLRHNRDYLALIRDRPLWFAPGTSERYSNGGYALLGEVIAKASGEDYYDYLSRHLFAPAGMRDTGYPIEGDGTPGLAHGYTRGDSATAVERDNVSTRPARGSAAGGGYATASDLLAFDRALLAGKLCSRAWAEWVTGGPRPDRFGAGAPDERPSFGFAGGAPGISSEWLHEGDVTLIVLTNRDPMTTQPVLEPLRAIARRMRLAAKRGGI